MKIDGYEILNEIKRGPISTVFLARQSALDRQVFVKQLNTQWLSEPDLLERFRREAVISARLEHPNITRIIDVGTSSEALYLISEYIDGLSLEAFMAEYSATPPSIILQISYQILLGLAYAHDKGVIHRDIKPSNIMISGEGEVKIADFGLARVEDLPAISSHGSIIGTQGYMSPEQVQALGVDERSDLFSLGVTLYELCGGKSPFRGNNIIESVQKLLNTVPEPLTDIRSDLPEWYSQLVHRLMDKEMDKRPASAQKILKLAGFKGFSADPNALVDYMAAPEDYVQAEPVMQPSDESVFGAPRKKRLIPALIGLLLLAIVVSFQRFQGGNNDAPLEGSTPNLSTPLENAVGSIDSISAEPIDTIRAQIVASLLADTTQDSSENTPDLAEATRIPREELETRPNNDQTLGSQLQPEDQILKTPNDSTGLPAKAPATIHPERSQGTTAGLHIICSPWADIYIDDVKIETTPLLEPLTLAAGKHSLELRNPRHNTYYRQIELTAGEVDTLEVNLRNQLGYLQLQVMPWAHVYIGGEYQGTTPLQRPIALSPGRHAVKLINSSYRSLQDTVKIVSGETVARQFILRK